MKTLFRRFIRSAIRYRYILLIISILINSSLIYKLKDFSWPACGLITKYPSGLEFTSGAFPGPNAVSIIIETKPIAALATQGESGSIRLDIKNDSVFNADTLFKIWRIDYRLAKIKGINPESIVSLLKQKNGAQIDGPPDTDEQIAAFKKEFLQEKTKYKGLVSKNWRAALIEVEFYPSVSTDRIFSVLRNLRNRNLDSQHNIHILGQAFFRGWLSFYLRFMILLFIATGSTISLVLFIFFRARPQEVK